MLTKLFYLSLLGTSLAATAQESFVKKETGGQQKGRTLNVGDMVPDTFIPKILNDTKGSAMLSDYKDRLLIVDFWDTNCKGCIAAMPRLEALQKRFGNTLKILPVTVESAPDIKKFLAENHYTKDLNISTVVEDKTLGNLFRYKILSHEAWIYKGKLVALTQVDYIDSTNIQFILDGKKNNWPVKDDYLPPVDYSKPFLQVDNRQYTEKTGPLRYVAFFGYRPNIYSESGVAYDSVRHTRRDYFTNYTALTAYMMYWSKIRPEGFVYPAKNRIVLEVKDSTRFKNGDDFNDYNDVVHRKLLFCYESVRPDNGETPAQQAKAAITDLDYFLGVHARYEKRKTRCLVLVSTGATDKLKTIPAVIDENDRSVKTEHGSDMKYFLMMLNETKNIPPVIDETNYKGEYFMQLKLDSYANIPALRTALQAYGLDLKEEEREIEMFVVTDNAQ